MTRSSIAERIGAVREAIHVAAERAARNADEITIIGVCKTVERDVVDEAFAAGIRHFGENRVQNAARKFETPLPHDGVLHMIGQLQSNKASAAARLFHIIESVDRASLVDELAKQAIFLDIDIPLLLQINVAREAQKAGCDPDQVDALIDRIIGHPRLRLDGLMTIAPLVVDAEEVRPIFSSLRLLRDALQQRIGRQLSTLSMGMSNDFAVAIEEGATHVRVGRAIFGG